MFAYVAIGIGLLFIIVKSRPRTGVCIIHSECNGPVRGTIRLFARQSQTLIKCDLHGLTPGLHGLHVHRCGDFSQGCSSTCEHYNPGGRSHGGPTGSNRHRGDFGNILADVNGHSSTEVVADVTLDEILGRAFIVHAGEDDLGLGGDDESTRTGNAGARIAGGIIRAS